MIRSSIASLVVLVALTLPARAQVAMENVILAPQDYAGQTLRFDGVALSGHLTVYDVSWTRKYYLTVRSADGNLEVGFFLAPPALADQLYNVMNARSNYTVNLTCRVQQIAINNFFQWHGIVTRVDLLDENGQVSRTVKLGN
jgi:hypothetical protein